MSSLNFQLRNQNSRRMKVSVHPTSNLGLIMMSEVDCYQRFRIGIRI